MLSKRYWNLSCTKKRFLYQSELEITCLQKHYKNWLGCETEVTARVSITSYIRISSLSGRKIICMHLTCFQSSITICMDSNYGQRVFFFKQRSLLKKKKNYGQRDLRGMTESSHHSARTSRSVLLSVWKLWSTIPHLSNKSPSTVPFHTAYRLVFEIFDFPFHLDSNY